MEHKPLIIRETKGNTVFLLERKEDYKLFDLYGVSITLDKADMKKHNIRVWEWYGYLIDVDNYFDCSGHRTRLQTTAADNMNY